MSTKKTTKKLLPKSSNKTKKIKAPKFKLISYTLKAVIPTGQYANIQSEVTVQADSIADAERAVMPYIETLFAKYRDGGSGGPQISKPVSPIVTKQDNPHLSSATVSQLNVSVPASVVTPEPAIVMTVPFNRAKTAIESCMSLEALTLVSNQIQKSTKLIDSEKLELTKLIATKSSQLNGPKTV